MTIVNRLLKERQKVEAIPATTQNLKNEIDNLKKKIANLKNNNIFLDKRISTLENEFFLQIR